MSMLRNLYKSIFQVDITWDKPSSTTVTVFLILMYNLGQ